MWGYLVQCTTLILIKLLIKRHIQSQKPLWKQCRWQWPRFGRVWMPRAKKMLTPGWKLALGITKGVQSFLFEKTCNKWFVLKTLQFKIQKPISAFSRIFMDFHRVYQVFQCCSRENSNPWGSSKSSNVWSWKLDKLGGEAAPWPWGHPQVSMRIWYCYWIRKNILFLFLLNVKIQ